MTIKAAMNREVDDEGERKGEGFSRGLLVRDEERILEDIGDIVLPLRFGFFDHFLYLIAGLNKRSQA